MDAREFEYVPGWEQQNSLCADCGTVRSVKYTRSNGDRVCNLCCIKLTAPTLSREQMEIRRLRAVLHEIADSAPTSGTRPLSAGS